MTFSDIIGHEKEIDILRRSIATGRLAHAYLFSGPEGIGKKLVALNFAKALNCEKSSTEPCDSCHPCRKIETGSHIDVQVFAPRGLARQLKVDQIEQLIQQINLKPFEADMKVFILVDADRANASFQNKILKELEEPPENTVIILTTSNQDGLLPTIRSRCQVINFSSLPIKEVEKYLTGDGTTPEEASLAAALSQGEMGRALQWLDKKRLEQRQRLFALVSSRTRPPVETIIQTSSELETYLRKKRDSAIAAELDAAKKGPNWANMDETGRSQVEDQIKNDAEGRFRQDTSEVLNCLASLYRDMLILQETGREDLIMNIDILDVLKVAVETCNFNEISRNMKAIESARESIARNVKISTCLEALLLRLSNRSTTGARQ